LLSSCEILQVLMGWAGCHGGWGIYNIDVKHFKKKMNYILEKGAVWLCALNKGYWGLEIYVFNPRHT